jgi:hypothetical protein
LKSTFHRTVFDSKILLILEIPPRRVYPMGLGSVEDSRVTHTGFRPDPYTSTVFAGPGTGRLTGTRGCKQHVRYEHSIVVPSVYKRLTHAHPYQRNNVIGQLRRLSADLSFSLPPEVTCSDAGGICECLQRLGPPRLT